VIHTEHGREAYATRWRTRVLGRVAASFCDAFYCLTKDMAEEVRAARVVAGTKIRTIENGIDVSAFKDGAFDGAATRSALSIPTAAPLVGTVGRLSEIKRQDVLLRAFALVKQRVPDAHLLLVGDGPLLADLRSLAERLGVADAVRFAGYQPHSGPLLKAMDVFALTSRSEGMPQAVIEASVMGLPVVASRVGGLPEIVEDGVTGTLFEAGDHDALAAALTRYLQDAGLRRRTGAAAAARVTARFDVARMALEYQRDCLAILRRATTGVPALCGAGPSRLATSENVP
jgi:glycosyltransferase involved in cell wall biosynthesis